MPDAIARLRSLRHEGGCFPIGTRTRLRVTGTDRVRYLNGQASNDLRHLSPGQAMRALVLTAKGKLCADVFVWAEADSLAIDADPALGETLLTRLERYAIADDVTFELVEGIDTGWHAFGPSAPIEGLAIRRLGSDGRDISGPFGLEASPEEIELLRIERGLPRWGYELTEDTLPQEAALEDEAVNFSKGCYVGQETVSRLRSVGHVNRRIAGFIGGFSGESGSLVLKTADGNTVGRLTSFADHPELGKKVALGYLSTKCQEQHFSVFPESGACLGAVERSEFPLVP